MYFVCSIRYDILHIIYEETLYTLHVTNSGISSFIVYIAYKKKKINWADFQISSLA